MTAEKLEGGQKSIPNHKNGPSRGKKLRVFLAALLVAKPQKASRF